MGRRVTLRAGRRDPRQGGDRVVVRRKDAGWIEVRAWRGESERCVFVRDVEAAALVGLLEAGPPWGVRGRVTVRQAGEQVQIAVSRGASKPARTVGLRAGEVAGAAEQIGRVLAGTPERPAAEVPSVLRGRVR